MTNADPYARSRPGNHLHTPPPARSMSERGRLLLELADDELIVGWRDSEWTGIAPTLEEDVAFSSIAQNEIGHARAAYELLGDDADALAFDRRPEEYRCDRKSTRLNSSHRCISY